jgi:hypothetical protein
MYVLHWEIVISEWNGIPKDFWDRKPTFGAITTFGATTFLPGQQRKELNQLPAKADHIPSVHETNPKPY